MVKQKKKEYKNKIYTLLTESRHKDPKEYWKILTSFNKKIKDDEDIPEILKDQNTVIEHFRQQGKPDTFNSERMLKVELNEIEENMSFLEDTDKPIKYAEVKKVIKRLKIGKSAGPDRILNEIIIIKYSMPVMIKSYLKIFNVILKTGIYPSTWKNSYIIPIHKSGDKTDPSNYRGVSLISCLPKIFNAILNNRLCDIIETKLSKTQFGFRENHRTSDSIFVLKSLLNKYIKKDKKKIYACFIDLKKAFDSVWRNALLYKLSKAGVGKRFYNIIKQQYCCTQSSLKYKNLCSDFFEISRGVKQGDSLSPSFFNLYINDITNIFENIQSHPLKLITSNIGSLLFTDDILILSESKEGLQHSLIK